VVAVDSGLGHLAAAVGTPVVGLFGSTDPARTGLRGAHTTNLASDFPCAPCLARRCVYRGPAVIGSGTTIAPPCFSRLPPDRVWEELNKLVAVS
jgi:heptosyltransferase-1